MYTREGFVTRYTPFVNKTVRGTGLFPGTVFAQAIIESQGKINGVRYVGGSTLSQKANNYFGIKCHGWKGRTFNIDTGEYTPKGQYYVEKNSCFRAYDSVEDSIKDYVNFLLTNDRYRAAGVFDAKSVDEQADALKRGGYATSTHYAQLIKDVYGSIKGYIKSAYEDPKAFIKRNWWVLLILMAFLAGIGVIITKLIQTRK